MTVEHFVFRDLKEDMEFREKMGYRVMMARMERLEETVSSKLIMLPYFTLTIFSLHNEAECSFRNCMLRHE